MKTRLIPNSCVIGYQMMIECREDLHVLVLRLVLNEVIMAIDRRLLLWVGEDKVLLGGTDLTLLDMSDEFSSANESTSAASASTAAIAVAAATATATACGVGIGIGGGTGNGKVIKSVKISNFFALTVTSEGTATGTASPSPPETAAFVGHGVCCVCVWKKQKLNKLSRHGRNEKRYGGDNM
ncbi:hypothetical protein ACHAW5_002734 [Stephanodiscus triporus]|uniref:Uncharacterized protein n=1 Tax=Stephanodiscus triporus TaxID=2934178 RepID=A0ABD3P4Y6_9STRA